MDLTSTRPPAPAGLAREVRPAVAAFAAEVGRQGPVAVVGARTQWHVGGPLDPAAREVRAPAGIVEYEPAEMVVRCGAGTSVAELAAALAGAGQMVPLDPDDLRATVGGLLAVGHSGIRRLRFGPIRDTLLEATFVDAGGAVVTAGGPVVKNVTGYDLCRLLVGSLGTLGLLAEVVLRAQPRPPVSRWLRHDGADPFDTRRRLFRPSAVLWDGSTTWVLLEGNGGDVASEQRSLGAGWSEVEHGPSRPAGGRRSLRPSALRALPGELGAGEFLAEIGVGTVHVTREVPPGSPDPSTRHLHEALRDVFDPERRLNPGRRVHA
ncbi:MAG TPA: FAD-binding protein [Acidimicrobiales bacterium]|nr:FAD-binding protein [Acidimicrobiales bacterium]